ncbi:MAG: TIGR00730 family Rossman fold protein [Victivallales bacterium]|nr:TIGR00730 family Rossman fold protein [Victivallales bacterium]
MQPYTFTNEGWHGLHAVAVYCGATLPKFPDFIEQVTRFGTWIGEHGLNLVYGGSDEGTMKVLANAVSASGGKLIGVFTQNLPPSLMRPGLDESYIAGDLAERKAEMLRRSDCVVALPGSYGTWDELFDALALRKVMRNGIRHPIGVLNIHGFFDPLLAFIENSWQIGFTTSRWRHILRSASTPDELFDVLAQDISANQPSE